MAFQDKSNLPDNDEPNFGCYAGHSSVPLPFNNDCVEAGDQTLLTINELMKLLHFYQQRYTANTRLIIEHYNKIIDLLLQYQAASCNDTDNIEELFQQLQLEDTYGQSFEPHCKEKDLCNQSLDLMKQHMLELFNQLCAIKDQMNVQSMKVTTFLQQISGILTMASSHLEQIQTHDQSSTVPIVAHCSHEYRPPAFLPELINAAVANLTTFLPQAHQVTVLPITVGRTSFMMPSCPQKDHDMETDVSQNPLASTYDNIFVEVVDRQTISPEIHSFRSSTTASSNASQASQLQEEFDCTKKL